MSNRETLRELAERVEKAAGPDRDIDRAIQDWWFQNVSPPSREHAAYPSYKFTASLDAAMMLTEGTEQHGGPNAMLRWALDRMAAAYAAGELKDEAPAAFTENLARFVTASSLKALAASEEGE